MLLQEETEMDCEIVILSFDDFDTSIAALKNILDCVTNLPKKANSNSNALVRDLVVHAFDQVHPQVADKLLVRLRNHGWNEKTGQFNGMLGPINLTNLGNDIDAIMEMLHSV